MANPREVGEGPSEAEIISEDFGKLATSVSNKFVSYVLVPQIGSSIPVLGPVFEGLKWLSDPSGEAGKWAQEYLGVDTREWNILSPEWGEYIVKKKVVDDFKQKAVAKGIKSFTLITNSLRQGGGAISSPEVAAFIGYEAAMEA